MRLIDADALKEKLCDTRDGKPVFRHTEFIRMDVLEEAIDKAPTIKTFTLADIDEQYRKGLEKGLEERPHGEWGRWIICEVMCPECLRYFDTDNYVEGDLDKCPSCGAVMRPKEGDANV